MFAIWLNPHWECCLDSLNKQVVYATFPSDNDSRNMTHKTWSPTWVQEVDQYFVIIVSNEDNVITVSLVLCLECFLPGNI